MRAIDSLRILSWFTHTSVVCAGILLIPFPVSDPSVRLTEGVQCPGVAHAEVSKFQLVVEFFFVRTRRTERKMVGRGAII